MKKLNVLCIILLVSILVVAIGVPAWGAEKITIGVIGPMKFVQGKGHWNGAKLARDQINKAGGVKVGDEMMKIKLIKADSNESVNVTDAANAMERLMTKYKVDFVIGGFRSEAVLAMQDIAMEHKTIFIGVGAAHNELCLRVARDYDTYKYWFRGSPFRASDLGRTAFIHLGYVAAVLKKELNIPTIKVAVVGEKAMWVEGMVRAAKSVIPKMGMEVAGIWRPSPKATDVTAELSAIQRAGAHIIFTVFSDSVGIPFARQAGELKIPAVLVGINVEAQKDGFIDATQGMGNYVMTMNTYARTTESNEKTKAFVDAYVEKYGETPTYTADTYSTIVNTLVPVIEEVGSLDADKIIDVLEDRVYKSCSGTIKYMKDSKGQHLHELTWGPGYVTGIGTQWQDGKLVGVWPYKWKLDAQSPELTYKGIVPYKIPPWVIEKYKK